MGCVLEGLFCIRTICRVHPTSGKRGREDVFDAPKNVVDITKDAPKNDDDDRALVCPDCGVDLVVQSVPHSSLPGDTLPSRRGFDSLNCVQDEMFFATCPNHRCPGEKVVKTKVVENEDHDWTRVPMTSVDVHASQLVRRWSQWPPAS